MNQLAQMIIISILSALLSGIIATIITLKKQSVERKYLLKLDVFLKFVGNRFFISGDNFSLAMNQIPIVFAESNEIKLLWKEMLNEGQVSQPLRQPDSMNRKILAIYKEMAKNLKINIEKLDDSDFLRCFNAKG